MTDAPNEREEVGALGELRRRKVVQWGLAYAAGAWALLQVFGFAADAFEWPAVAKRLAMLALVLGSPIAFVLAWYHGDKGEQRVTRSELAILTLLCLLGGGALWSYGQRAGRVQTADTTMTPATTVGPSVADARPSIAVLPFENRSRLDDDTFFVDGIHDDILTQLSKVSALKVISRTSVDKFRDTKLSTKEIAGQLGVSSILEGGVQRAGDRVRINVQLIDAASDAHLWAESYDRELTAANIFAIQSEVAAKIAGALKATLTASEKARVEAVPTQSLEAWENYQLGRQRLAKRTSTGLIEAERYFRKAIELDPDFALAHSGLADSLTLRLGYTDAPRAATLERAQSAVDAALKLDPGLADAWASAGLIENWRDHRDREEEMYSRAIDLNPNHVMARMWYGQSLLGGARIEEGVAQLEQAARLDPLSAIVRSNLGDALVRQGRFREAASQYRKAIEIDPLMPSPYSDLADLAAYAGNDFAAAVPLAEKAKALDPDNPNMAIGLVKLHWEMGDDAAFGLALRQAGQRWPDDLTVLVWLALRELQRRDLDGASERARRLLELDPHDQGGPVVLGIVDYRQQRYAAAAERFRQAYAELFATPAPKIDDRNIFLATSVVPILQALGDHDRANALLDGVDAALRKMPQLGNSGYAPSDAAVLALRGRKREALEALRSDQQAGWRGMWLWYRDIDPAFDSIRGEPEFMSIFADIERDMARQRAELAKRPKDAPLDLNSSR